MSSCFIVMMISLLLFFFIGLWLDNILPTSYGIRKSFFFCLLPSYWCTSRERNNLSVHKGRSRNDIDAENQEDDT